MRPQFSEAPKEQVKLMAELIPTLLARGRDNRLLPHSTAIHLALPLPAGSSGQPESSDEPGRLVAI